MDTQEHRVEAFCDQDIVVSTANWSSAIHVQGKKHQRTDKWGQFNIVFVGQDEESHSKLVEFASQNTDILYEIHFFNGSDDDVGSVLFLGGCCVGDQYFCVGFYNRHQKLSTFIPDLGFYNYGKHLWSGNLFISTVNTDISVPCMLTSQEVGHKVPSGTIFKLDVRNNSNVLCNSLVYHQDLQSDVLRISTLGVEGKKASYANYNKFVDIMTKKSRVVVVRGEGKRRNSGWLVYGMYQSEGGSALFCRHCLDLESFLNFQRIRRMTGSKTQGTLDKKRRSTKS